MFWHSGLHLAYTSKYSAVCAVAPYLDLACGGSTFMCSLVLADCDRLNVADSRLHRAGFGSGGAWTLSCIRAWLYYTSICAAVIPVSKSIIMGGQPIA